MTDSNRHTYDYGVVGNCAYAAHVGTDSNVAWMCWPAFSDSFIFGSLLDPKKGGEYRIIPTAGDGKFESKQYYIQNTNVLCTEMEMADGKIRITDFAPRFLQADRYYKPLMFVRKLERLEGIPKIKVRCQPVGDYGKLKTDPSMGSNHIRFLGLDAMVRLSTNIPLTYIRKGHDFMLNENKYLVLTYGPPFESSLEDTVEAFLKKTTKYWQDWIKTAHIVNFYQSESIRSALILKIHQYEDTGAIVASTTTSLPESPGSGRNWDYRYCWLRDAYYTLNAFNNIGHFDESEKYFNFLINAIMDESERYQPLYGIGGRSDLVEKELDLAGYKGNKPVRIGNDAYTHIQNDVYGQVLISLLPLLEDKRVLFSQKYDSTPMVIKTLKMIHKTLGEKDAGIWEFRNRAQYHTYTFLFHWAGACSAIKIGRASKNKEIEALAIRLQKTSRAMIENCFVPAKGGYSQAIGVDNMDASALQLIMMGYLNPKSSRAKSHLKALEKELLSENGLFYRYRHADDFGKPGTTFLICAFWYVEALACVGRIDDAVRNFENIVKYSNHLGLFSEDVNEKDGSMWGNFPQAYSHVGLLNAAYRIHKKLDPPPFL